ARGARGARPAPPGARAVPARRAPGQGAGRARRPALVLDGHRGRRRRGHPLPLRTVRAEPRRLGPAAPRGPEPRRGSPPRPPARRRAPPPRLALRGAAGLTPTPARETTANAEVTARVR